MQEIFRRVVDTLGSSAKLRYDKRGNDRNQMKLFRELSESEKETFRQWARDNYTPGDPINGVWHPIVQDECVKMNESAGQNLTFPAVS
jgi:hypothetical protein